MLKLLVKKQMTEIFRSYFYNAKKNRARTKLEIAGFIVMFVAIMLVVLGGIFTGLSLLLCRPLADAGLGWFYFSIMGLISILLGTFGSVFNTFACLYLPKDNDLLLSLPIPTGVLLTSRLVTVYLLGLMYSGVVILPAVIVHAVLYTPAVQSLLGGAVLLLLISIFVLTLSCVLGRIVAGISLRMKNKSLVTVVVSIVFICAYYMFFMRAQLLLQDLLANAAAYGAQNGTAPLLLCTLVCLVASMNIMAAPAFSLEGKTLWLLQSLPVTPGQVLRAKLGLQLLLTMPPAFVCLICLRFVYRYTALELVLSAAVILACILFTALLSLTIGLITANMSWVSEVTPIKQNLGVLFAMLGGSAYPLLLGAGYLLLGGRRLGFAWYMTLVAGATLALCALLGVWLRTGGQRRFAAL